MIIQEKRQPSFQRFPLSWAPMLPSFEFESTLITARVAKLYITSHRLAYAYLTPELTVLQCSNNFTKIISAPVPQVEGQLITELIWELAGAEEALLAILDRRETRYLLERVNREQADGQVAYLTFQVVPFSDTAPEHGLLLIVEDLTEPNQAQQKLAQERNTALLAQAHMAQNNMELARLSRIKSFFLALATRDLYPALTTIRQDTATLLSLLAPDLSVEERQFLVTIYAQSYQLEHLVHGLSDLDQQEHQALHLNWHECNLHHLLTEAQTQLHALAEARRLTISFEMLTPIQLWADGNRLKRVFVLVLSHVLQVAQEDSALTLQATRTANEVVIALTYTLPVHASPVPSLPTNGVGALVLATLIKAHKGWFEAQEHGRHIQWMLHLPLDGDISTRTR